MEKEAEVIHANKAPYSVKHPGIFGARVEGRQSKTEPTPLGVGDSLLINLARGIFAVADSPEWNPAASGEFLSGFDRRIERLIRADPELCQQRHGLDPLIDRLVETTNDLIGQIDFRSSTTFTCLFVIAGPEKLRGLIFHSGDSCLFKIDLGRKKISQISRTNMDMVGRSKKLSQVELIEINETTRFVICSDGLQALSRHQHYRNIEEILLDGFSRVEADQLPDSLIDHYGRDIELPDDVAVIALDPNNLPGARGLSLPGGETDSMQNYESQAEIVL